MHRKKFIQLVGVGTAAQLLLAGRSSDLSAGKYKFPQRRRQDYSIMWWAGGVRSPDKIFNIQTGFYGLSFDYANLGLRKIGRLPSLETEADVLKESNAVIESLPEVTMTAFVERAGKRTRIESPGTIENCQLVESGAYFQRRWMPSLNFGEDLKAAPLDSGMELAAWPEKFIISLRVQPEDDWKEVKLGMRFTFPGAGAWGDHWEISSPHSIHAEGNTVEVGLDKEDWPAGKVITIPIIFTIREARPSAASLSIHANTPDSIEANTSRSIHSDTPLSGQASTSRSLQAYTLLSISAKEILPSPATLKVNYDPVCDWYTIPLAEKCLVTIKNAGLSGQAAHLNFSKEGNVEGIPGICGVLCDMQGHPLGLPIQVSKDWHDKPARFSGLWYRGICVIYIGPGEEVSFVYNTVHNTWNNLPAVSMSQLCLIGWGHNQLWLQSAIGSWGESITFEPDQTHGKGLVLDSRPLAVWGMGSKPGIKWSWTHNMGGADLLVYYDEQNEKRWPGRTKTRITQYGPLLSRVAASMETDDGKMNLDYTLSLHGTDDYVRGIYRFKIIVKEDLRFRRLVIFQCGSDDYNYTAEKKMAIGNERGLIKEWNTQWGDNVYRTSPMALEGSVPWISLHEGVRLTKEEGAIANRGIVIREWKAMINGSPALPYAAERGTFASGNKTAQIDIMLPPDVQELMAGDYIEGQVEHIIMPQYAHDYFGSNRQLALALKEHQNTWQMIHREVTRNTPKIDVKEGVILSSWPVKIQYAGRPLFLGITGGLAWLPVTFTGLSSHTGFVLEEWIQGRWRIVRPGGMDNGWQTDLDMSTGLLEVTYLLFMDTPGGFTDTPGGFTDNPGSFKDNPGSFKDTPDLMDDPEGKDRARRFRFTV